MTTRAERRADMLPTQEALLAVLADLYRDAALAGADMRHAVEVLEPLRTLGAKQPDVFELWNELDVTMTVVVGEALEQIIGAAREQFIEVIGEQARLNIEKDFAVGVEHGRLEWLRAVGEALGEFRLALCGQLLQEGWLPTALEPIRLQLVEAVRQANLRRWEQVQPAVEEILLPAAAEPRERALLLAVVADIELIIASDLETGGRLAEEAAKCAPDEPRGGESVALWHQLSGRPAEAEATVREWLKRSPQSSGFYKIYSDSACNTGDLKTAEERLLDGVSKAPHSDTLYLALIQLYGVAGLFDKRQNRLPKLAAQGAATDAGSVYDIYVALACVYRDNSATDRAAQAFQQAVDDDPARSLAYVEWAGLERKLEHWDAAERLLDTAERADPADVAVYAARVDLYMDRQLWADALTWSARAIALAGADKPRQLARQARLQCLAGNLPDACVTAMAAVRLAPANPLLVDEFGGLTTAAWAAGDHDFVAELYGSVRSVRGPGFEAEYQNLMANAAYSAGDNDSSVTHYLRAVEQAPNTGAYHTNLARALARQKHWADAEAHFRRAIELGTDKSAADWDLAMMFNDRANDAYALLDYPAALNDYRAAVQRYPDNAVLQANLAIGLEADLRAGEKESYLRQAVQALGRAIELEPTGTYGVRQARLQAELDKVVKFGELILTPAKSNPIALELGETLVAKFDPDRLGAAVLAEQIPAMRAGLREVLGIDVPGVQMRAGQAGLDGYRILINGIVRAEGQVPADEVCVYSASARLLQLGAAEELVRAAIDPVTGQPCCWLPAAEVERLGPKTAGLESSTDVGFVLRHVADAIHRSVDELFGLDAAKRWIDLESAADEGSNAKADRSPVNRTLIQARTLRALVRDGMRLDADVLQAVDRESSRIVLGDNGSWSSTRSGRTTPVVESAPFGAVAQSIAAVRRALPGRLPGNAGGRQRSPLPGWAEAALEAQSRLTPRQEHELLRELLPVVEAGPLTLLTRNGATRAYVQRLLTDQWGSAAGADVRLVTAAEVPLALPVQEQASPHSGTVAVAVSSPPVGISQAQS